MPAPERPLSPTLSKKSETQRPGVPIQEGTIFTHRPNPENSSNNPASKKPDIKKRNPIDGLDKIGDLSQITESLSWLVNKFSDWTKLENSSSNPASKPDVEKRSPTPDVEKKPGSQDKIYDLSKIEHIKPPSPETPIPEYGEFSKETQQVPLFTNEKLTKLITELDEHEEHVVISGSGDIIPNLYMKEKTKRVRAVDISLLACFFSEVKLAAFESLDYEQFRRFFNPRDKKTLLSSEQYERLKPSISKHAQDYFGQLIHSDGNSDFLSVGKMFLYPNADVINRNPYLESKENYEKAQSNYRKAKEENPKPVTFYPQTITEFLDNKLKSDHIYLSNIFTCGPYFKDGKIQANKIIEEIKKAYDILNPKGQISIYNFGETPREVNLLIANTFNDKYPNNQMNAKIIKGTHNDSGDKYSVLMLKNN
jgi:hypothetical protein